MLIAEYVHEWRDFKRGAIHPPEKPNRVIFGLGFLGAGLVAIGVAGEFRIHVKAGRIEADMRDAARGLVAIVEKEAANANDRAKLLEHENLELREKLAPRRLSEVQQRRIASALARFKGQGINLFVYEAPNEIMDFGSDMENTLGENGAGWRVSKSWGYEKDRAVSGVLVEIIPIADPSIRAASTALVNALRRERVVVAGPVVEPFSNVGGRKGVQGNNAVRITVGIRP